MSEAELLFQEATTSQAFSLSLTKRMVALLLALDAGEIYSADDIAVFWARGVDEKEGRERRVAMAGVIIACNSSISTTGALMRRGLVAFNASRPAPEERAPALRIGFYLTKPGRAVCELLSIAGFGPPHPAHSIGMKKTSKAESK